MGVVEEETCKVVPVGLIDPGAGRGIGLQPGRSLSIALVGLGAFETLARGLQVEPRGGHQGDQHQTSQYSRPPRAPQFYVPQAVNRLIQWQVQTYAPGLTV